MADHLIQPIQTQPGIERDGTDFDSKAYLDGQWVRFYKGRPRKIGGYRILDRGNETVIRSLFLSPYQSETYCFIGRWDSLRVISLENSEFTASEEIDRTPETGFENPSPKNIWSFASLPVKITVGNKETLEDYIFAQVSPDGLDLNSDVEGGVFFAQNNLQETRFVQLKEKGATDGDLITASGGIVSVGGSFLFVFGSNGSVRYTNTWNNWKDNNGEVISGEATIANTKIIQGMSTRGGGVPAVLFWSVNSLIRGTFTRVSNPSSSEEDITRVYGDFSWDLISESVTILAENCVVSFDQTYYWIGTDRFYSFNGVVQPLQNTMSRDFFFDNLNYEYRNRVWSMAIARYNEIWWFFPKKGSTECNHVLIYNIEDRTWYDMELSRSCGVAANIFRYPIMADPNLIDSTLDESTRPLWTHENGLNRSVLGNEIAIQSYFETNLYSLAIATPDQDSQIITRRIEPDFVMKKNMTLTVKTRSFAQGPVTSSEQFLFSQNTPYIDIREQGGLVSYRFESSSVDGDYQAGQILINYLPGTARRG